MKTTLCKILMVILSVSLTLTPLDAEAKRGMRGAAKSAVSKATRAAKNKFLNKMTGKKTVKTKAKTNVTSSKFPRISAKKTARKIVKDHAHRHSGEFDSISNHARKKADQRTFKSAADKEKFIKKAENKAFIRRTTKTIKQGKKKLLSNKRAVYNKGENIVIYNPNVDYKGTSFRVRPGGNPNATGRPTRQDVINKFESLR